MRRVGTIACMATVTFCLPLLHGVDGVQIKPVRGTYPKKKKEMVAAASSSGLIVGPRHILTNRHVVLDKAGGVEDGFEILLPQDYKRSIPGRAIFVSPPEHAVYVCPRCRALPMRCTSAHQTAPTSRPTTTKRRKNPWKTRGLALDATSWHLCR